MQKILMLLTFLNVMDMARAQKKAFIEEYISTYAPLAIEEQIRTGIPASIKMAQAIHESGAGQGELALRSNNHFGIKCKSNWTGATAYHDDDEQGECFRAYGDISSSYTDHSNFLKSSKRYAHLFLLDPKDYVGWANGLKQSGYATNPKYPGLLIHLIEEYELNNLTLLALSRKDPRPESQEIPAEKKENQIFE